MTYFKEIVTKAVIGKGKRTTNETHTIKPENKPDTVLGCWIINHKFNGVNENDNIKVLGSYDVNVWYSYDNNSKTGVTSGSFNYSDIMNVPLNNNLKLTPNTEVLVTSLTDPNVIDVSINNETITFTVKKELGIEVVGDTKIRVNVEDNFDDYSEIYDTNVNKEILNQIDMEIDENYLNEDNKKEENSEV